jgi:beta-galactosidase
MGKQKMQVNSYLEWKVKYEPGTLSAKGHRNSVLVATDKVETAGEPAAIRLTTRDKMAWDSPGNA